MTVGDGEVRREPAPRSGQAPRGAAANAGTLTAHRSAVYAICRAFLHNDADAEDAAQEALLRCIPHAAGFRGDLPAYVNEAARNVCRNTLRRRSRSPLLVAELPPEPSSSAVGPDMVAVQREFIRGVVRSLNAHDRTLIAYRAQGYTCAEIAARMGLAVSSVTSGLTRAYRRARQVGYGNVSGPAVASREVVDTLDGERPPKVEAERRAGRAVGRQGGVR